MAYALGIDLGTTFSAAALTQNGRTEIFPLGNRAATIPSVVVLRDDGEVLIGDAAVRRSLTEPMRTAREFKRRLGDPTPLLLGGTPYGAESLMAKLLAGIVRQVVEQQGEEPARIVVSHPANYGPYKLDLLQQAVRMAEIGKVSFIAEPVAAALHYAERERIEPGEIVAVYDFGGGTFDAALLRKTSEGFEEIGEPEGLERLGGVDFDEAVFAHVAGALGARFHELDPLDPATTTAVARLRDDCREAKEALSLDTDATIPVLLPNVQTEVRITRSEFEDMIRPRIHETISALQRAIRSGGVATSDVAKVLLVGGSSRIPLVGQMVREATGMPVAVDAHPKHAIALGAALAAAAELREPEVAPAAQAGVEATRETAPPLLQPAAVAPVAVARVSPADTSPVPAATAGVTSRMPARNGGARLPFSERMIGVGVILVLLIGVGGFLGVQRLIAEDPIEEAAGSTIPLDTSDVTPTVDSALAVAPTPTPQPVGTATPVATRDIQIAVNPTATSVPPTATARPTATEAPTATAIATAPPTAVPTATPPVPPGEEFALITDILWHVDHQHYHVAFEMFELTITHPDGIDDPGTAAFPRPHVHFFGNPVPPTEAGVPGGGPWELYGGPSPFNFDPARLPEGSTEICVLIADSGHSVTQGTGNCFPLPPRE